MKETQRWGRQNDVSIWTKSKHMSFNRAYVDGMLCFFQADLKLFKKWRKAPVDVRERFVAIFTFIKERFPLWNIICSTNISSNELLRDLRKSNSTRTRDLCMHTALPMSCRAISVNAEQTRAQFFPPGVPETMLKNTWTSYIAMLRCYCWGQHLLKS